MSRVAVGTESPSYWCYMSAVLARNLDRIARSGEVDATFVPPAIYDDAKRFLSLALQSAGDGSADDPQASMNAYSIAVDAAHGLHGGGSLADVDSRLADYSDFLSSLRQRPRKLTEKEQEIGQEMSRFFRRLLAEGEASRHEAARGFGDPQGWNL